MKGWLRDLLVSACIGLLLPGAVLQYGAKVWDKALTAAGEKETNPVPMVSIPVDVRTGDGSVIREDMDSYLVGVLLGEMPAWFEEEALKAQSIVARTYARKAYETGGKHGDGSICREAACCQAWLSEEDYLNRGGSREDIEKIRAAVQSTSGNVLTYDGALIEATYFSCSGGRTEDAAAVWGREFPYLQSVESPGEEEAAAYEDTVAFSRQELERKLGVSLSGPPETWTGSVTYTEGGGVASIAIGGILFTGTEVRTLLGLRSTAFAVTAGDEGITITTRGYGHRVGMSQYGADAMAVQGSTCEEILAHYYRGAELTRLTGGSRKNH